MTKLVETIKALLNLEGQIQLSVKTLQPAKTSSLDRLFGIASSR